MRASLVNRFLVGVLVLSLLSLSHPPHAQAALSTQQGAAISPSSPTDFASSNFQQSIQELAADHANAVSLVVPYYQSTIYSTDIQAGWNTPTDSSLIAGIETAQAAGLQVMLTLHDDPYTGEWRAEINPSDRVDWFNNYGSILDHYAALAQAHDVASLTIGTELYHMTSTQVDGTNTQHWLDLIVGVRSRYGGIVTYSANWGAPYDEKDQIGFWSALDEIGISAYFSLDPNQPNPSLADLTSAWASWNASDITPLEQTYDKPVVFTEVGYESQSGAHNAPGVYNQGGSPDQTEQANDYQALLAYWSTQPNINGVYFWGWSTDPNAGGPNDNGFTPQHKTAEQVMQQWFSGFGSTNIPAPPATLQTSTSVNVWWPLGGSTQSGLQPFKAVIEGRDPSTYTMYWQVDGGQLNLMDTSYQDVAHKEADVDLSGWNWNVNGQYQLSFVAKDVTGLTIASTTESIQVLP